MGVPRSLGELLLEERLVDEAALRAAERHAHRNGCALVHALLEEGRLGEEELLGTLERRLGLPRADLTQGALDLDALRLLPLDTVERFAVLPLALERQGGRRVLRLAMADPLDQAAIEEIEYATGCRVDAQLAAASEVGRAIQEYYRGAVTKLIRSGDAVPRPLSRDESGPLGAPPPPAPSTQPRRLLLDEAPVELKLRALLRLLYARNLITEEEFAAELQALWRGEE